jgi:hypothetical protein
LASPGTGNTIIAQAKGRNTVYLTCATMLISRIKAAQPPIAPLDLFMKHSIH